MNGSADMNGAVHFSRKGRKSVVVSYAGVCAAIIIAGVACIAAILLVVTAQFYKTEKRDAMSATAKEVADSTKQYFLDSYRLDMEAMRKVYVGYASSSETQFTLIDRNGKLVLCSEYVSCIHSGKILDPSFMKSVLQTPHDSTYFTVSTLGGLYDDQHYLLVVPVSVGASTYYVLAAASATNLNQFLWQLISVFFMAAVGLVGLVFWGVYLATRRMMKPIQDMTLAAEAFGKGDFSQKIVVNENNEIGRLAMSFNDMAYSLANFENTRKAFVANVSHELKTPMTTIGGFVDGILDGTIPESSQRHYLTIVSQEVSRLARLVRSMLNITKYETGEIEMSRTVFDITDLTIKTVLLFEDRINGKNLEVEGLEAQACFANADMDLTQQILYNLVENAVKFVNKGGTLSFAFSQQADSVSVAIKNTGDGLAQEDLPKIFDRFYKTDESHGIDKTGVGLGLSIVRSIINLHNGQISVRSAQGEFTEFSFNMPGMPEKEAREILARENKK